MSRRWAWPRSWWSRCSRPSGRSTSRAPRSSWSSRTPRWRCRSRTGATSSGAARSCWPTPHRTCGTALRCRRPTWAGEVRLPLIDADELARLLPMPAAIDALERAFAEPELSEAPQRTVVEVAAGELLLMPAAGSAGVGVKLVTLAPDNPGRGLPFVQAAYVLFDPDTLSPRAVLDGTALTSLRTAAVSGVATRHLAGPQASRLVIFGARATATAHLDALVAVRPIPPLGAYRPDMRELDDEAVARARLVVETREAALAEAGDLLIPMGAGRIGPDHVVAELGEVVRGAMGRRGPEDVTLFKSVGIAPEDLAVARAAPDARG